jgi:hypothetical protein
MERAAAAEEEAEGARRGIERARGLLSQGRTVEALKVVCTLLRGLEARSGGGAAGALAAAAAASASPPSPSDLARLLEQVSLATEEESQQPKPRQQADGTGGAASLLAETGRARVAADAVADGSSAVCSQCGGVIAARRMAQHALWCSGGGGGGEEAGAEEEEGRMEEG